MRQRRPRLGRGEAAAPADGAAGPADAAAASHTGHLTRQHPGPSSPGPGGAPDAISSSASAVSHGVGEEFVDLGEGVVASRCFPATPSGSGPCAPPSLQTRRDLDAVMGLTRKLRTAPTWRELRRLLAAAPPGLVDAGHLATAAKRLRVVTPPPPPPPPGSRGGRERSAFRAFVGGLLELSGPLLPDMEPSPLVAVLYGASAVHHAPPAAWMTVWLQAAAAHLAADAWGPRELCNAATALGRLSYDPGEAWLGPLCETATRHMQPAPTPAPTPAPPHRNPKAAGPLVGVPERGAGCLTPQGLSQLAWGLGRLGFCPPQPFWDAFFRESGRQLPGFTAQGLANTLWALAVLRPEPPGPWVTAAGAAFRRLLPSASSFELSLGAWALVRLGFQPAGDWLAGFLAAAHRALPAAEPEHAARVLWVLAVQGVTPPDDWIARWLSSAYVRLLEADCTALATMAWSLARLGIRPGPRWTELLLASAWEAPLRAFAPHDLALLLWGLAHGRAIPEPAWMDEFWLVSYRRLRSFAPRHLALLLWSCVTLGQAPTAQWLAGYEAVTAAAMRSRSLSAEGISLVIYSYGMLEISPSADWLAELYDASLEAGLEAEAGASAVAAAAAAFDGWTSLGLERLIWGVAKAAPPPDALPSRAWVAAFLDRFAVQVYDDGTYGNLANAMFALALLGVRPGGAWLGLVMARVDELSDDFGQATLVKLAWALPRLAGHGPRSAGAGAGTGTGASVAGRGAGSRAAGGVRAGPAGGAKAVAAGASQGGAGEAEGEAEGEARGLDFSAFDPVAPEQLAAWQRLLQARMRVIMGLRPAGARGRVRGPRVAARRGGLTGEARGRGS
ncbi:hypothetical protein HYH03_010860 [Edaphochlamys debaryana]|uniref:Tbc2 translation factor, chloroplastic n=1 Tax=Edaphochlamys debaryana TaxID=47281 RepID=A0A835Y460_9CHLO|nr:hypothetical protein HYH03_010860 [Edaphochlamys debaryana]|eukprot:KAG2490699.1 hypothetical protein HYH03_010860 [Edaphochlamys debaryana]